MFKLKWSFVRTPVTATHIFYLRQLCPIIRSRLILSSRAQVGVTEVAEASHSLVIHYKLCLLKTKVLSP